jgi:hypothetical protein
MPQKSSFLGGVPKTPKNTKKHGDGASDTDETRQNSYCLDTRHPPRGGVLGSKIVIFQGVKIDHF